MSLSRSDLIEAAWSLSIGLGEVPLDDLRKKAIRLTGGSKELTYEELSTNDKAKAAVDRIVEEMQESSGAFKQILQATARLTKLQFDALVAEGFTPDQALQIVCSQSSSPSS